MISNSDFEKVIDCLPEGFTWGSALTPDIALHIVNVAEASAIKQLEADLADARKDQARYKFVRGMEPEDFGNLSTYCDDFDCQVDDLMKRCKQ